MAAVVCFTGHRTVPDAHYPVLASLLKREILTRIQAGATVFRTGGAIGFDTLAALTVLSLQEEHPSIRLELILPCPTQTRGWRADDRALYEQILGRADAVRYLSTDYYEGVLQMRNRALVEGADICIAYLRSSHGGGTAYTYALALKNRLETVNLFEKLETEH